MYPHHGFEHWLFPIAVIAAIILWIRRPWILVTVLGVSIIGGVLWGINMDQIMKQGAVIPPQGVESRRDMMPRVFVYGVMHTFFYAFMTAVAMVLVVPRYAHATKMGEDTH